jgi:hypothetical protein
MVTIVTPLAHGHRDRPLAAGYARQRLSVITAAAYPCQQMNSSGNDCHGEDRAIFLREALNIGISAYEIDVGL